MIENPKVGQRGIAYHGDGDFERFTILTVRPMSYGTRVLYEYDCGGKVDEVNDPSCNLYDSPRAAAAALRQQAQKLLLAASKLEQEAPCETESR